MIPALLDTIEKHIESSGTLLDVLTDVEHKSVKSFLRLFRKGESDEERTGQAFVDLEDDGSNLDSFMLNNFGEYVEISNANIRKLAKYSPKEGLQALLQPET